MKKLLILCLICALAVILGLANCNAQPTIDWGYGFDLQSSKPVMNLSAGYEAHNVQVQAVMSPCLSRSINANNYFGIKAGYDIAGHIIPSVGYYYNLHSDDNKSLNQYYPGVSLKGVLPINERGGIYLDGMYIHKSFEVTAGFHIVL